MRRPQWFGPRSAFVDGGRDVLNRRQFLTRTAQIASGGLVAAHVVGCADASPTEPARAIAVGDRSMAVSNGEISGPLFYPEDFALDVNDAAPAINRALLAAAPVNGTVLLGRDYAEYFFRSHVWIEGTDGPVTLRGTQRTIKLLNAGGVGYDGRPARILMRRLAVLRDLTITPASDAQLEPLVPGVDAGASAADGSSDYWMVDNCSIHHFTGIGINLGNYSSFVTITSNRIQYNGDAGVQVNTHCNSCRLANNLVSKNARNGVDINGNDNIIEYNLCTDNGTQEGATDRNGILVAGILGFPSNGNIVRFNRCLRNLRCGIFLGGETMYDTRVIGNEVTENAGAGIMVEAMTDANRNEALLITDNRMIRNRFYGFAENGTGSITYAGFARNNGSGNRPSLLLQSAQQGGLRR